ncbi:MAG: PRC-barrel domain-containing protein [Ferruginibacter sp.]
MGNLKEENMTGKNLEGLAPNKPLQYLTATSIIGDKVNDKNGESVGKIENIMLDIRSGKIDYYVIQFSGFLGFNLKLFAIPFNKLEVDAENECFIYNGTKEMLDDAPGFDVDHWPDTNFHREETYWHFL